ncbi:M23 family metallopeptidase [Rhodococcus sp. BP-349]|nr:M23 family metallopeptidase [Rhodococcus sp. BP-363]MBY6542624.1 M23 family metallopeptidase [Rhodococcus sp. BP-369]MBY6561854.1 M23 family metallopeptidase [Rhodococcus sp. BP-370]MBY6576146.1 M23 family metallopeptidase [Rhodococcus sp. BP-364]MBY6585447.1 M23 family metallopeptidase [Rhodococcus sp. BP-358]MBY6589784.1 M23 family metallopeptidase [Rhodococcus sp. BP-362]MBY6593683.1 M23 family metallopeptidase [Rhodococcus sp. BP-359]MBY6598460.1 M23 family metallopeptidase [Rhodococc
MRPPRPFRYRPRGSTSRVGHESGGRQVLQHHRTPFTRSRFVSDDIDDSRFDSQQFEHDTTVLTPADGHLTDTGPFEALTTDAASSPWDRAHESSDYVASAPAYTPTAVGDASTRRRRSVPATSFLVSAPAGAAPSVTSAAIADEIAVKRSGAHRIPAPPSALKGRVAVVAVAAGAVVAAGQAAIDNAQPAERTETSEYALAAGQAPAAAASAGIVDSSTAAGIVVGQPAAHVDSVPTATSTGAPVTAPSTSAAPQILNIAAPVDLGQFSELLAKGQRFSEEREAREAAARRPLFALPALGTYTSGFGSRWGTLHAGVDIANAIGTPVYAVADGTVIDSGPAAGFGLWVRLQHADGTITVYGHIDSSEVQVGQTVMAGDEIAKMGNRGQSTGPHLHFEVHLTGDSKIDPLPWLASRGIALGPERD